MSGGVDSSVAAALLQRDGYDVVGCFMRLGSPGETLDELKPDAPSCDVASRGGVNPAASGAGRTIRIGHQGCCSINDAADARLVAAELRIPFYVCNFKKDFGRIIDYFVDEYARGRTPNPCVRCNDWLKFGKLHDYAQQIGAQFVASGHYARVEQTTAGFRLLRGVDHSKDQSYVLFGAPRDRLAHMLLPVGVYEKPRIREMARELGLPVFDKPDSQEVCFVPDNDYAALVDRRRPDAARSGNILDTAGNVVGEHDGQHRFTIGQRRGLSVAVGRRIYVVSKDAESNTVTVGSEADLLVESCEVTEGNWLVDAPMQDSEMRVFAKFRYNTDPTPASVRTLPVDGLETPSGRTARFRVTFDAPQPAVAAGQAMVLYDAQDTNCVLGGGWITRTVRASVPG